MGLSYQPDRFFCFFFLFFVLEPAIAQIRVNPEAPRAPKPGPRCSFELVVAHLFYLFPFLLYVCMYVLFQCTCIVHVHTYVCMYCTLYIQIQIEQYKHHQPQQRKIKGSSLCRKKKKHGNFFILLPQTRFWVGSGQKEFVQSSCCDGY